MGCRQTCKSNKSATQGRHTSMPPCQDRNSTNIVKQTGIRHPLKGILHGLKSSFLLSQFCQRFGIVNFINLCAECFVRDLQIFISFEHTVENILTSPDP